MSKTQGEKGEQRETEESNISKINFENWQLANSNEQ